MTGAEIKERREAEGWSQHKLADLAGIAASTVSGAEAGLHALTPRSALALRRAFGLVDPTPTRTPDGACLMELGGGALVAVDLEDFERFGGENWHRFNKMAARQFGSGSSRRYQFLHRLILGVTDPMIEVWFRDRNPLNCRRENLMVADKPSRYTDKRRRQMDYRLTRQLYATWDL
jgi:transcriptional regulator with XRE-family HTH domain